MPEVVQARQGDRRAEGWAVLLSRNNLLGSWRFHKATVPKKSPSPTARNHRNHQGCVWRLPPRTHPLALSLQRRAAQNKTGQWLDVE